MLDDHLLVEIGLARQPEQPDDLHGDLQLLTVNWEFACPLGSATHTIHDELSVEEVLLAAREARNDGRPVGVLRSEVETCVGHEPGK